MLLALAAQLLLCTQPVVIVICITQYTYGVAWLLTQCVDDYASSWHNNYVL
jgi:hypothetical protein